MYSDYDQKLYHVHSNTGSFHKFHETFAPILDTFEDDFNILTCDMIDYFEDSKQPLEEFKRKMDWCYKLKNIISKHNPTWLFNVVPTGSTVTGLATQNSDLDVAIHIPQAARALDQEYPLLHETEMKVHWRRRQLEILQIIRIILKNDEQIRPLINWEKGVQLVQAQIQILKVETVDNIECDISVVMEPFLSSMHNSFMIRHFVKIDNRFAPLCAVVKQWGSSTGVKNPKDGGFNSYALVLLVIHFLQCGTSPPILPNLSKLYEGDNFIAKSDIEYPLVLDFGGSLPRGLPEIRRNNGTVSQLFLEFLHYYLKFDFQNYFISMKDAGVFSRRDAANPHVREELAKEVYIEDPFDAHNPGRTVRNLNDIKKIFRDTINMFIPQKEPTNKIENQLKNFHFPNKNDILYMKADQTPTDDYINRDEFERGFLDNEAGPSSPTFAFLQDAMQSVFI